MKKQIFSLLFIFFCFSFLSAQVSSKEKDFVKGSLSDKIAILQALEEGDRISVGKKGLDFSVEHASILGSDPEFIHLAIACINVFPDESDKISSLSKDDRQFISERLMAIFRLFREKKIREAALTKLTSYYDSSSPLMVDFFNDYLSSAFQNEEKQENVIESAISFLGHNGDADSLSIIYNIWVARIWPDFQKTTDSAIVELTQDSFGDAIKIFSVSNIKTAASYLSLLHKSEKISEKSLCDIAENALLIAINNAEKLKASGKEAETIFAAFQLEAQKILSEHKWSHSTSVINSNVRVAKKSYDEGFMSEADFVKIIKTSVLIPSSSLAQSLTEMLSECNGKMSGSNAASGHQPAKSVVLALISALGALGDKTAFDTLLTVTYSPYSLDVIDEAKASLAKLNW